MLVGAYHSSFSPQLDLSTIDLKSDPSSRIDSLASKTRERRDGWIGDFRWRPSGLFRPSTLTRSLSPVRENPFGPRGAIRGQRRDKGIRVAPLYVVTAPQLFVSIRHAGFISAVSACTKTLFSIARGSEGKRGGSTQQYGVYPARRARDRLGLQLLRLVANNSRSLFPPSPQIRNQYLLPLSLPPPAIPVAAIRDSVMPKPRC